MHPADIQALIKKQKTSQAEISRKENVSDMSISRVVNKSMISDRLMKAVSEAIGEDHRLVFPEYYFGKNRRRKLKSKPARSYTTER